MKNLKTPLFLATATLCLFACASDKKEEQNPAGSSVSVASTPVQTAADAKPATALASVLCKSPFSLEASGLRELRNEHEIESGKWELASQELYALNESDNGSYYVTSSADDEFDPALKCNGLNDLTDENAKPGTKASSSNTASLTIPEWVIMPEQKSSPLSRELSVRFENGKLVALQSKLVATKEAKKQLGADAIHRMEIANDTYLSARHYLMANGQRDVRLLLESPANKNGKRSLQFMRIVMRLAK